jgi:hypothetical protein
MAKNIKKEGITVGDLVPASYNPRKITEKQLSMLKKSMAEFGDLSGVVVNVRTGRIIGGHQRTKNLDKSWPIIKQPHTDKVGTVALGYIETPDGRWQYREVDWTEKKEAAANVSANKHGGEFDLPLLKEIILTLDDGAFDMELTGFNSHELELMMTAVHQEEEKPESIISKNFNQGKGQDENEQKELAPGKYPVTFIFDQSEWEAWEAAKDKLKVKDDKTALLKIIGGKNA